LAEGTIYVNFKVSDTEIKRVDSTCIYSRLEQYLVASFELADSWSPFTTIEIIFNKDGSTIKTSLIDGKCQVPDVYLAYPGEVFVSVVAGVRRTTNSAVIRVWKSGYSEAMDPPDNPLPPAVFVQSPDGTVWLLRDRFGLEYSEDGIVWKTGGGGDGLRRYSRLFAAGDFVNNRLVIPATIHQLGMNAKLMSLEMRSGGAEDVVSGWRRDVNGDFIIEAHNPYDGEILLMEG